MECMLKLQMLRFTDLGSPLQCGSMCIESSTEVAIGDVASGRRTKDKHIRMSGAVAALIAI